ncbi:dihydroorotate dehydrogenase [Candidatus Marinimicrobia bacterium MT.SAG.3]|nr:dihydroorotate dehydrogenase [Candidatus Marinimicrobia bacterium MT.SAG.3]
MNDISKERWDVDFSIKLGSLILKNPLLAASGTYGYGRELNNILKTDDFGGICTKSITPLARDGNEPPRIAELKMGMLNSIGLANVGVHAFIQDKIPFLQSLETNVIVNIAGFSIEDYIEVIQLLEDIEGIDGYEINISCPNVEGGLEFGSSSKSAAKLTKALRAETDRFLMVKLSPNITDISKIAVAVEGEGADSLSLINTLIGMGIEIDSERPTLKNVYGGYSGPAIKPVALAMVHKVFHSVKIPIVGIGGISSAEDVIQFMLAGATAVQLGTVNFLNPIALTEILEDLVEIAESKGIRNISDFKGRLKEWD